MVFSVFEWEEAHRRRMREEKESRMIGRWILKYRKIELADGTKVYYLPQDKIWNPNFIETMTVYSNNKEN